MSTHPLIVGVTGLVGEVQRPQSILDRPVRSAVEMRLDIGGAWKQLLEDPSLLADHVEWFSADSSEVAPPPLVIATCRREEDGGEFDGTESERVELLNLAANLCDYVDIESGVQANVPKRKTIRSYHDFEGIPDFEDIYERLKREGGAIFKIVGMATQLTDNLRVRDFLDGKEDVAAFLMGEYGVPSRILAPAWGSRLTYASLSAGQLAPGMLDFQRLCNLYRADEITDEFEIFGIAGQHVGHSLSPAIHNVALREAGRRGVYLPLAAKDVDDWLEFASRARVVGASVTIPFKEQVVEHCKKLDEASETMGAVNTLLWLPEGGWRGRNVDWSGLLDDLKVEYAKPLFGRTALILGAGGAARACVYGLMQEGVRIRVWNRNHEQAQKLCEDLAGEAVKEVGDAGSADLLINCTPCGMEGEHEGEIAVKWDKLKLLLAEDSLVYDVIYEPEITPLLDAASRETIKTANGLGMLRRQATLQGQIFGYPLPHDLPEPERMTGHIWLVGYRGVGKSSLARELSIKLRRRALDTDAQIELQQGTKIRNIFEDKGENAFRDLETLAIIKAGKTKPDAVIAVGGGAVERDANIEAMRKTGMVLFLDAPVELLEKRLGGDEERPSLTGQPVDEEVHEMLEKRRPLYEKASHVRFEVKDKGARELAGEIAEMLAEFRP